MGTGEGEGERRSLDAAEAAIANPLLDDISMKGAKGVLINITGGSDMTLFEVDEAANRIRAEVDEEAYIIFGSTFDDQLEGKMRISVVATGMSLEMQTQPAPVAIELPSRPKAATVQTAPDFGVREGHLNPAPEQRPHLGEVNVGVAQNVADERAETTRKVAAADMAAPSLGSGETATPAEASDANSRAEEVGDAFIPPPHRSKSSRKRSPRIPIRSRGLQFSTRDPRCEAARPHR